MLSKVLSLGLSGVNGYEVQTECYIGTDFRRSIWSACRMRPLKRRASGCAPRSKTAVSGFLSAVLS